MKIIVCIKQVPDSAATIIVENGLATWPDASLVANPWDEFAIEAALVEKEKHGGEVIALSIGPEVAKEALKFAMAMGCSEAALVLRPEPQSSDGQMTARILAAAINKIGGADLVIMGKQAIDTDMGTTAAQVARILKWPALTLVSSIELIDPEARLIRIERAFEEGRQVLESRLPAVVSVVKDIGKPRYPSFMGIRKAQTAPIQTWSAADLGLAPTEPAVHCIEVMEPPQRQVSTEIIKGQSPQETAESLVEKILAEKII